MKPTHRMAWPFARRFALMGLVGLVLFGLSSLGYAQSPAKGTPTASEQAAKKQKQELARKEEARKRREAAEEKAWQQAEETRKATETLQTSPDPEARWKALRALGEQPRWLAEWAPELGRIINEGGPHAAAAAGLLSKTGNDAIPVVVELARAPSLDTRMRTTDVVAGMTNPNRDAAVLLGLLRPMLKSPDPEVRIAALLPLSGTTLEGEALAEMTRQMATDPSEFVRAGIAVMIRGFLYPGGTRLQHPKLGDLGGGDWEQALHKSDSALIRYVGEVEWEVMRRRNSDMMHVVMLTPKEVDRRTAAEEALREPARAALRECEQMMAKADTPAKQLCVFRCLTYLYSPNGVEEDREAVIAAVRSLAVPRGSVLEQQIRWWLEKPRCTGPQRW